MFNAKFGWNSGPVVLKMLKFTDRHTKEKKVIRKVHLNLSELLQNEKNYYDANIDIGNP